MNTRAHLSYFPSLLPPSFLTRPRDTSSSTARKNLSPFDAEAAGGAIFDFEDFEEDLEDFLFLPSFVSAWAGCELVSLEKALGFVASTSTPLSLQLLAAPHLQVRSLRRHPPELLHPLVPYNDFPRPHEDLERYARVLHSTTGVGGVLGERSALEVQPGLREGGRDGTARSEPSEGLEERECELRSDVQVHECLERELPFIMCPLLHSMPSLKPSAPSCILLASLARSLGLPPRLPKKSPPERHGVVKANKVVQPVPFF